MTHMEIYQGGTGQPRPQNYEFTVFKRLPIPQWYGDISLPNNPDSSCPRTSEESKATS